MSPRAHGHARYQLGWIARSSALAAAAIHAARVAMAMPRRRSSGAAHRPLEGWSAYCSGKAALAMLTRAVALEHAAEGIRVFGFAPGTIDTDMQVTIRASGVNQISRIPRGDLAPVSHPAQAIVYLCGSGADDLAGQELSLRDEDLRCRVGLPAV